MPVRACASSLLMDYDVWGGRYLQNTSCKPHATTSCRPARLNGRGEGSNYAAGEIDTSIFNALNHPPHITTPTHKKKCRPREAGISAPPKTVDCLSHVRVVRARIVAIGHAVAIRITTPSA